MQEELIVVLEACASGKSRSECELIGGVGFMCTFRDEREVIQDKTQEYRELQVRRKRRGEAKVAQIDRRSF